MKTLLLMLLLTATVLAHEGKHEKPVTSSKYWEVLPAAKLAALKKEPCTFFHVWATWCTICLQELPDLLKQMATWTDIKPVVVDVSKPFVQDGFSKKWISTLKPSFKTYLKPEGKDEPYLSALDKEWSGALPFSVLYHKGTRKKAWVGSLALGSLKQEIATLCKLHYD